MRAIILAAGRGSRMRTLTEAQPKCLTQLAGKALLEWQLAAIRQAGISKVAVVRGYLAEKLNDPQYHVFDNPRWSETNMLMSLACAESWLLEDECVISYSDIVYHPKAVQTICQADGDIAITYDRLWQRLWEMRFENPLADAETFQADPDGYLQEIGQRAATIEEIQGQYMGLLKFTPAGWSQVRTVIDSLPEERRNRLDMTSLLKLLLEKKTLITTAPVDGQWCEVDNENDLCAYENRLNGGQRWSHDWRF